MMTKAPVYILFCSVLLVLGFAGCQSETIKDETGPVFSGAFIDTTSQPIFDSAGSFTVDVSRYLGNELGNDSIKNLAYDTISKEEFEKYKKTYSDKIDRDSLRVGHGDTTFTITGEKKKSVFLTNITEMHTSDSYVGYLKPLNLYLVESIDGHNETGSLILIDAKSTKAYYWESLFDEPLDYVSISPGNQYLLAYANSDYEHANSYISVLKINSKKKDVYSLETVLALNLDPLTIKDLVWENDKSIVLSVVESILSEEGLETSQKTYYLKITFKD